MKKLILSLFLSIIGFIGFSNAGTLNCSGESGPNGEFGVITCSPSSINSTLFDEFDSYDFTPLSSNLLNICDGEDNCTFNLYAGFESDFDLADGFSLITCNYPYDEETPLCSPGNIGYTDLNGNDVLYFKGEFNFSDEEDYEATANLTINVDYSVWRDPDAPDRPTEPDEPDEPGTGGNENPPVIPDNPGEGGNTGGLVVGGISEFTPIITGLKSAIIEFIPYVVYVGVGLISAILGFFALKRLINWTRRKTLTNFTSRRLRK